MPTSDKSLPTRLARLATLARIRLVWERYVPIAAVPALALSILLILTWLGLWEVAGDPFRILAVLITVGLIVRAVLAARRVRFPSQSHARRRLERTAGLSHRPLDTLVDAPVLAPDLWPAHVVQAQASADTIRRVGRTPTLSPMDRYGLRIIMPMALGLALFLSWGLSVERVRHALSPTLHAPTNPYGLSFEAWVDPPDYTGRPPIYAQGDGVIRAPVGSTLVVRASGSSDLPRPRYIGDDGQRFLTPAPLGQNSAEVRTVIDRSGVLDWRIGILRKAFTVDATPDAVPRIDSLEPPETDKRDRLVLVFDAADDYGVEQVLVEMVELSDGMTDATAFDGDTADVDTQAGGFTDAKARTIKLDLTRHPLAGRKVIARLVAVDGAGQRGVSAPFYTTVPDKIFIEPLAKAIVEQRGLLMTGLDAYTPAPPSRADNDATDGTFDTFQTDWRLGRAAAPVKRTVALIDAVTDYPDPNLFNDPAVYIGLRHVSRTLRYARSESALVGLPDHLWKIAIRAEFGLLGTALQEMQDAQEDLREGIARRAPEREVDTLFSRYNQAVDAYMEELRKNATVGEAAEGSGEPMGSTDEIQALLDAIEEANRNGDTEGARRALAQLAELLENMQMQINPGSGGGEGDNDEEMDDEMRDALEDLADTLGEQRELQDQTRQAERDELRQQFGAEPSDDSASAEELAERQQQIESLVEGLREQLAESGERAAAGDGETSDGEPSDDGAGGDTEGDQEGAGDPAGSGGQANAGAETDTAGGGGEGSGDAFERALGAMRESEAALGRGDLGGSRQAQAEAISALRDAGDAIGREMDAEREGEDGQETDALGRDLNGANSDNAESDIDGRDNAERARDILDELRRRAADAERDQQEQDYLDRLLKRF